MEILQRPDTGHRRGAAMILCMMFTAIVLSSVTVSSLRTVAHVRHSQYAAWHASAMAGAELVLDTRRAALERGDSGSVGFTAEVAPLLAGTTAPPSMEAPGVMPEYVAGVREMRWYAVSGTPAGYAADLVVIVAVAEVHGVHGAIEGVFRRDTATGRLRPVTWRERVVRTEDVAP